MASNAAGTDTRPPMLVESDYDSWKIRIHRYIRGKPNGKLIWKSIQNGPTPHPMVTDPSPSDSTIMPAPRKKLDSEFNEEENKLEMADTRVLNSGAIARYSGDIARGVASTLRNRPRRHLEAWRAIRRHIARYSLKSFLVKVFPDTSSTS
ncbi:hypothetical protein Tco_1366064 [Tanacetum coccineum]